LAPSQRRTPCSSGRLIFYFLLGLLFLSIISIFLGRYPFPGFIIPSNLGKDELAGKLIFNLRLPRMLTSIILGMSLGASGAIMQMIFGNPLVEPGFLGVSQGAAFGAAFAIIFLGSSTWAIQGMATFFAFLGLFFSYGLAHRIRYGGWILRLLLAGICVSALYSAGLGVLKYMADPLRELPEITFWLLGGLWGVTWQKLFSILPVVTAGLLIMYLFRWRLNLFTLGDATAFSLGVSPVREKALLLASAVASTASVVSISGMVGWVGLIVPHLARRIFGVNTRYSLPGAMVIGAIFALFCDDVARTILSGEIPLGILTSLIGASFFLLLMSTGRGEVLKR